MCARPFSPSAQTPAPGRVDYEHAEQARHLMAELMRDCRGSLPPSSGEEALCDALERALCGAPGPDRALLGLARFLRQAPNRGHLVAALLDRPRFSQILAIIFSGSDFLTEILLRNPEYVELLGSPERLSRRTSQASLHNAAHAATTAASTPDRQLAALRRLHKLELLRIGTCDLLGLWDLAAVTEHLSFLADALIAASLRVVARRLDVSPEGFVVLAMGKLGGRELNYSSDVDLVFPAEESGDHLARLGAALIDALSRSTTEDGFVYRVDMRLRPWGGAGPLVTTAPAYLRYLRDSARLWERQALLSARVVAGDRRVGETFLRHAQPLLFDAPPEAVRADMGRLKADIEGVLRRRGVDWGAVKSGPGSIRDVEFVAQFLQLLHGRSEPWLLTGNTLEALDRLATAGHLTARDHGLLREGYRFLRPLEHYLQLMHYRQIHELPREPYALQHLARRLGFDGPAAAEQLVARYDEHSGAVRAVYERLLGEKGTDMTAQDSTPAGTDSGSSHTLREHLARMAPSYRKAFRPDEVSHHAELATRLAPETNLVGVEAVPLEGDAWRLLVVGYDHPGELSLICGLLLVHGLSIDDGHVFTYDPPGPEASSADAGPRKIVDVFTVHRAMDTGPPDWARYAAELEQLLQTARSRGTESAQGDLARRVATALHNPQGSAPALRPINLAIHNDVAEGYTVLEIDAPDTPGFLYELSNALWLCGHHIARVAVQTVGRRARDTLYLTDAKGRPITDANRLRALSAATVLVNHFTHLLPLAADPQRALLHVRSLLGDLLQRPDWADELASLDHPAVLAGLTRLLGVSDYLWEDLLRLQYDSLLPVLREDAALRTAKSRDRLRRELDEALRSADDEREVGGRLLAFRDREMFRIDLRHIQGYAGEFGQFSAELTDLAEVVIAAAADVAFRNLARRHGRPRTGMRDASLVICALGKCGGRELGYASDIELMFVYREGEGTDGPDSIPVAQFYERLVTHVLGLIAARREGVFELDLRLRPYGAAGSLAVSVESFRRYYRPGGPAWPYERQALVRLRTIHGDASLGRQVLSLRDAYVYDGRPFDLAAMRAMRERQLRHLVEGGTLNAKFSPGGLVDVEYLVQALQIHHGAVHPTLRLPGTLQALEALAHVGSLTHAQHRELLDAYTFLRRLIDALRMVRGNARDLTVPSDVHDLLFLARRLGYGGDVQALQQELAMHMERVRSVSGRLLRGL